MSEDARAPRDDDELRALFRARAARAAATPVPTFDAVVSRRLSKASPRRVAAAAVAGGVVATALVVAVVLGVRQDARQHDADAIALPAIRMPSDAVLAAAPLPNTAAAWSSLPSDVLGRAAVDLARSRTR